MTTALDIEEPLMTTKEVAKLIGVSWQTVARWREIGKGPGYAKLSPGRCGAVRYDAEVVREWLKQRTCQPGG